MLKISRLTVAGVVKVKVVVVGVSNSGKSQLIKSALFGDEFS